jgi:hypothetical protein
MTFKRAGPNNQQQTDNPQKAPGRTKRFFRKIGMWTASMAAAAFFTFARPNFSLAEQPASAPSSQTAAKTPFKPTKLDSPEQLRSGMVLLAITAPKKFMTRETARRLREMKNNEREPYTNNNYDHLADYADILEYVTSTYRIHVYADIYPKMGIGKLDASADGKKEYDDKSGTHHARLIVPNKGFEEFGFGAPENALKGVPTFVLMKNGKIEASLFTPTREELRKALRQIGIEVPPLTPQEREDFEKAKKERDAAKRARKTAEEDARRLREQLTAAQRQNADRESELAAKNAELERLRQEAERLRRIEEALKPIYLGRGVSSIGLSTGTVFGVSVNFDYFDPEITGYQTSPYTLGDVAFYIRFHEWVTKHASVSLGLVLDAYGTFQNPDSVSNGNGLAVTLLGGGGRGGLALNLNSRWFSFGVNGLGGYKGNYYTAEVVNAGVPTEIPQENLGYEQHLPNWRINAMFVIAQRVAIRGFYDSSEYNGYGGELGAAIPSWVSHVPIEITGTVSHRSIMLLPPLDRRGEQPGLQPRTIVEGHTELPIFGFGNDCWAGVNGGAGYIFYPEGTAAEQELLWRAGLGIGGLGGWSLSLGWGANGGYIRVVYSGAHPKINAAFQGSADVDGVTEVPPQGAGLRFEGAVH